MQKQEEFHCENTVMPICQSIGTHCENTVRPICQSIGTLFKIWY